MIFLGTVFYLTLQQQQNQEENLQHYYQQCIGFDAARYWTWDSTIHSYLEVSINGCEQGRQQGGGAEGGGERGRNIISCNRWACGNTSADWEVLACQHK